MNQCLHNSSWPPEIVFAGACLRTYVWHNCLLFWKQLDQQNCLNVGVDEIFVDGPKIRALVLYIMWKGFMPHQHTVKMFVDCVSPPQLIIVSVNSEMSEKHLMSSYPILHTDFLKNLFFHNPLVSLWLLWLLKNNEASLQGSHKSKMWIHSQYHWFDCWVGSMNEKIMCCWFKNPNQNANLYRPS